jgi:hypothetical protein
MTDPPTSTPQAPDEAPQRPADAGAPASGEGFGEAPGPDAVEAQLAEAQAELETLRRSLSETRRELEGTERRQRIDQLLVEADAIDLQAARLLTEAAISEMDEADVAGAVDDLRRHKPYLFRRRDQEGAMSPRPRPADPSDEAAAHAAATGDRRDLLRYLRLRRATV